MEINKLYINIALTLGVLLFLSLVTKLILRYITSHTSNKQHSQKRKNKLLKTVKLFSSILVILVIISIWGLHAQDIWLFVTTLFGFIGIAFFAAWSLLSNLIAAYILFFSSNFTIGDTITFKDGDNTVAGVVTEMSLFFVRIKLPDNSVASIPNNIVLQRVIIVNEN